MPFESLNLNDPEVTDLAMTLIDDMRSKTDAMHRANEIDNGLDAVSAWRGEGDGFHGEATYLINGLFAVGHVLRIRIKNKLLVTEPVHCII